SPGFPFPAKPYFGSGDNVKGTDLQPKARGREHTGHDDLRLSADGPDFALPRVDASFCAGGADGAAGRGGALPGFVRRPAVVVLQSVADARDLHLRVRRDLQVALERADDKSRSEERRVG